MRKDASGNIVANDSPNAVTDWCNDFGKYELHREMWNPNTNVLENTMIVTSITDITNNFYIDNITIDLKDFSFRYYVRIYDNAGTNFRNNLGNVVRGTSNQTIDYYAGDTIIPGKAFPIITDVLIETKAVATATISWNTDQPTGALLLVEVKESRLMVVETDMQIQHPLLLSAIGLEYLTITSSYLVCRPKTEYEYRVVSTNYPLVNTTIVSE